MTIELVLHAVTLLLIALIIILWRKAPVSLTVMAVIGVIVLFVGSIALSFHERLGTVEALCAAKHMRALVGSYNRLCYDDTGRVFVP